MPSTLELGKLVSCHPGLGVQPPTSFNAFAPVANDSEAALTTNDFPPPTPDNNTIAEKAVQDSNSAPSIWFVNFPSAAAAAQQKTLADYMQNTTDYRCWASFVWWSTTYNSSKIPQDASQKSTVARSSYCARVAAHHTKMTPWLPMNNDNNFSKIIQCKTTDFHTELITNVLDGFVAITPAVLAALEGILLVLAQSSPQTTGNPETKTIVCERFEYLPEVDRMRSFVRLISFSVSEEMGKVNNAKKTEQSVRCTIEYNEYDAVFNQKIWLEVAANVGEESKSANKAFVEARTVDCPP